MTVRFTDEAWRNFQSIRHVIARDRPQAAKKMAARLLRACVGLEHFPQRGRRGRRPDTRELTTVWPYVIVNEIKGNPLSREEIEMFERERWSHERRRAYIFRRVEAKIVA